MPTAPQEGNRLPARKLMQARSQGFGVSSLASVTLMVPVGYAYTLAD